jgi:Protein of unknown function (DUF4019)
MRAQVTFRIVLLSLLVAIFSVVATNARASDHAAVDAATKAADAWLKLVDDGQYQQSWEQACSDFKKVVTIDQWKQELGAVRTTLGPIVSRKLESAQYTTSLPGAAAGQYVLIRYDTVFKNLSPAVETLSPMLDKDGHWRVDGYYIK